MILAIWSTMLLLFLLLPIEALAAESSMKKGVATTSKPVGLERIQSLNVFWYYNWGINPSTSARSEYIPMVWGKGTAESRLSQIKKYYNGKVPVLLSFNEPDHSKQAKMEVEEAIALWPALELVAERISSPAAAHTLGPWMKNFMQVAEHQKLRVDFVAVHWYGNPDAKRFLNYIDRIYDTYKKPIWITEFAVADWNWSKYGYNRWSEQKVADFMREVLPGLEERKFIERYAWYDCIKDSEALRSSRLFHETGELTQIGKLYSEFYPKY